MEECNFCTKCNAKIDYHKIIKNRYCCQKCNHPVMGKPYERCRKCGMLVSIENFLNAHKICRECFPMIDPFYAPPSTVGAPL